MSHWEQFGVCPHILTEAGSRESCCRFWPADDCESNTQVSFQLHCWSSSSGSLAERKMPHPVWCTWSMWQHLIMIHIRWRPLLVVTAKKEVRQSCISGWSERTSTRLSPQQTAGRVSGGLTCVVQLRHLQHITEVKPNYSVRLNLTST